MIIDWRHGINCFRTYSGIPSVHYLLLNCDRVVVQKHKQQTDTESTLAQTLLWSACQSPSPFFPHSWTRRQDRQTLPLEGLCHHKLREFHSFLTENHGLTLGGADSDPCCFMLSCELLQWELNVTTWWNQEEWRTELLPGGDNCPWKLVPFRAIFTGTDCTGPVIVGWGWTLCDDSYRNAGKSQFKITKMTTE